MAISAMISCPTDRTPLQFPEQALTASSTKWGLDGDSDMVHIWQDHDHWTRLMLNSFPMMPRRRPQAGPKAEGSQMQMTAQPTPQNGPKNPRQRQPRFPLLLLPLWIWKLWGQSKWQSQLRTPGEFPHWKMNHRQQSSIAPILSSFRQFLGATHSDYVITKATGLVKASGILLGPGEFCVHRLSYLHWIYINFPFCSFCIILGAIRYLGMF